jgi:hypothetical protein
VAVWIRWCGHQFLSFRLSADSDATIKDVAEDPCPMGRKDGAK